jgi:hypothetical protein
MNNIKKSKQIVQWLIGHELISLNRLEEKLEMSQGCLSKAKKGIIHIPIKYLSPLEKELNAYGFQMQCMGDVTNIAFIDKPSKKAK